MSYQNAVTSSAALSAHDTLDISTKLGVLSSIQQDLAAHHGKALFVLAVLASWPTTLHVSWVSGGFAGGAAVVLLSDRTAAIVLLAGSKHGGGGVGAAPSSFQGAASLTFRVVAVICAAELIAHSFIAPSHLRACVQAMAITTQLRQGSANVAPASEQEAPPSSAPRFTVVSLAFCTILERARYVLMERCPQVALARMFHLVEFVTGGDFMEAPQPPVVSEALNDEQVLKRHPPPMGRPAAAPLGSLTSLAVLLEHGNPSSGESAPAPPLVDAASTPAAPAATTTNASPDAAPPRVDTATAQRGTAASQQFSSLSAFRVAALSCAMRSGTVTFRNAIRHRRDHAGLASCAAGVETLWCLSGGRHVFFTADANVRAAVQRQTQSEASSAGDEAPSRTTVGQPNNGGAAPTRRAVAAGASQQSPVGGVPRAASPLSALPLAVGGPPSPSAASLPQQLETKERTVAVCRGGIILLKKKSAFPPPLWCTAVSWNLVSRLVLHPRTYRSMSEDESGPAAASPDGQSGSKSSSGADTPSDAQGVPETAPLSVTVFVRSRATWGPEELDGTASTTLGSADVDEVFTVGLPSLHILFSFVFACRDAYAEFSNGKLLPVLPHGAEYQTSWIPIPVSSSAGTNGDNRAAAAARPMSPPSSKDDSKQRGKTRGASNSPLRPQRTLSTVATAAAKTTVCVMWPVGSDVDTPRRYPSHLFTIAQLSSASSVVAQSSIALSGFERFMVETPAVFMLSLQYVFLSKCPPVAAASSGARPPMCVDVFPLGPDGTRPSDGGTSVPAAAATLEEEEKGYEEGGGGGHHRSTIMEVMPAYAIPVLSAVASAVALHFAQLPSVIIGSGVVSQSNAPPSLFPGRLQELFLAAVALDVSTRRAMQAAPMLPVMPMHIVDHVMSKFSSLRSTSNHHATPLTFLICRWVAAIGLREMFQALRRWLTVAERRPPTEGRGSPQDDVPMDDDVRVRSMSAAVEESHKGGEVRRLSSAVVPQRRRASPSRLTNAGGATMTAADLPSVTYANAAAAVGVSARPKHAGEVLRVLVHHFVNTAFASSSADVAATAFFREVWKPRILALVDVVQSALASSATHATGPATSNAEDPASPKAAARPSAAPSTTTRRHFMDACSIVSVLLLDILLDLSIHHVCQARARTVSLGEDHQADVIAEAFLPSNGAAMRKLLVDGQQAMIEWLTRDLAPSTVGPTSATQSSRASRMIASQHSVAGSTRSETYSLHSLMCRVHVHDEHLLSSTYSVIPMSSSVTERVSRRWNEGDDANREEWVARHHHQQTSSAALSTTTVDEFLGRHVLFGWSPVHLVAATSVDLSPLTRLHRYLSSGVPGGGGTLWHELVTTVSQSPLALEVLQGVSSKVLSVAMGSQAADALLLRRAASTQTIRTSSQEAKLLEDHLALRSHIMLQPAHSVVAKADDGVSRSTGAKPDVGSPGDRALTNSDFAHISPIDSSEDLETNKYLMRRVLWLEQQLLDAHRRNAEVSELLVKAQADQAARATSQAAEWDRALISHMSRAQMEIQSERLLLVLEREAGFREALVNTESKEWFEHTSRLLVWILSEVHASKETPVIRAGKVKKSNS